MNVLSLYSQSFVIFASPAEVCLFLFASFAEGLDLVKEAIDRAGYNGRIKLAIDVAATEFCIGKTMLYTQSSFLSHIL